ncbi:MULTISPECIES: Gfo/Idh/MocA family protein [Curtobacterium]|uniref:Gfo/Idh/MocA family oxidoreductase n=1 Tax=Curtobacterium poinsettiae TaxID=159612 RepID=A0ABT3S1S8_9MICO|nr:MULTISPECIES: Gfo/Idh/MocA family oxidoreductase [Curtobacterium]MBT1611487.1 Gfo/Idh/MocA family oxidoreductase [Curtobacterium flaccumfaciens pv. poinsettiae]MCX2848771.1 Gfo/Idh/MocA family oxidoreductase [Curtobacterium flaccumfaciens pv. poinsettiae]OII04869.1 dehydrogenase [Curtobacterium sp. MCBA15_007]TPG07873.1 gfo/Idh/MocA family oxidoreductase [Curtobacterium flaccumfaciens]UXN19696.1 Gfo/Idh/MocA family oxidoreductase [Curtobacterium flaccumfaciens pv. poinsettiae]
MAQERLRVAMVGHGFMGAAHSQAWRTAPRFFDLGADPEMAVIVGRDPERTEAARQRYGWQAASTDWRAVVADPDIDVVDVVSPGSSHVEIAIAALQAGKHVLCEKPLANTVAEAEAMTAAADAARERGVRAMVGFSYRRVPAIAFARQLVQDGRIGTVRQVRALYLQDWLSDEDGPMTWRLDKSLAGSGALGDIGAHAIDLVEHVTGSSLATVSGTLETFVTERPLMAEGVGLSGTASSERGQVTVDDAAFFTARLSGGAADRAIGTFEATRYATGRKNGLTLEISGSDGAIQFDLEAMNELRLYESNAPAAEQGFRRILVTEPEHPYMAAWWPTGHLIGYEHTFSHQVKDFIDAVATGTDPSPSFADGLHVQRVLDAVERSAAAGSTWTATS